MIKIEVIKMKLNVMRRFENGDSKDKKEDVLIERESKFARTCNLAETSLFLHIIERFLIYSYPSQKLEKMCNAW